MPKVGYWLNQLSNIWWILSIGPPKHADAPILGNPCLAIAALDTRSETPMTNLSTLTPFIKTK